MTMKGSVIAASAMMATALLGGAAAQADQPTGTGSEGASKQQVQSESVVASYWTEDRMKNAKPGSELMPAEREVGIGNTPGAGIPTKIGGQEPQSNLNANDRSKKSRVQYRAASEAPVSHIGKVFFTLDGTNYVCSGNSVVSNNENTVSTVGHCLKDGAGAWATKFAFVPAYEDGNAPYGVWAAESLYTTSQWSGSGDISYDTAFAVVSNPNGSSSLNDSVGASGVAFNQARGLDYKAFGYPAGAPYDGTSLYSCSGTATADPFGQSMSQGIPCDMTGGSSGGPWFIGSSSTGVQNSVNSFGYTSVSNTMFGPYWGSSIQSAYSNASNS